MSRTIAVCLLLVVSLAPKIGKGQSTKDSALTSSPPKTRPKIGLVLSGGGARGWAHVGVLKWFEEHRIPVDYIAGTSMGGLVGAMYAMGASPGEIKQIGKELDWDKALSGPPSFDELSFRRKEDQREYPSDIELGAGKGINLPSGVNPGHNIGLIFDQLTLPYATLRNFDNLPIPFRCVATDMLDAREVVFQSGSLSKALRATMSIPGVFTPVEINNMVLADGGLLNNIPTDVAREMGADIIIAINVGTPLGTREDIQTLPGMLSQIIGVATIESDRRHLKLANLAITPDLGRFTLLDFKEVEAISELGYKAASQNATALEEYALNESDWASHMAARRARRLTDIPTPVAIDVDGTKEKNLTDIKKTLSPALDKPVDPEALGSSLSYIRGDGRYESLDYTLTGINEPQRLQVHVKEKGYGPALMLPIVQFRSSNISNVKFSIGSRFTMFDVGTHGSELRLDAIIGSDDLIAGEYYRPLDGKNFFVAPRAYFWATSVDLFQDGDRVAEYRERKVGTGIDLGYTFNRKSQFRLGYEVAHDQARVQIGDPLLPKIGGLLSVGNALFVYEGLNNAMVPTRGASLNAQGRWFFAAPGSSSAFPQAEIRGSALKPVNEKASLFTYGSAGTSFSHSAAPLQQFTLGGPFRLGAFGPKEFRGDHYLLASGGYLQRVGYLPPFLGTRIFGAGWYEVGSAFLEHEDAVFRSSVSGALIMETRLGPLVIGGAVGSDRRGKIFVSMGRIF